MASVTPIVSSAGALARIQSGDYIAVGALGSGTPSSSTYLRGDGTWAADSVFATAGHTHAYLPLAGGTITGTTESSSTTTGALVVNGGVGIAKNLNVGGRLASNGYFWHSVLTATSSTVQTHGMKIKTNIPAWSDEMMTVIIEGYDYRAGLPLGIMLTWYGYGATSSFINYSASSFGGQNPAISLSIESGKVVIFLDNDLSDQYYNAFHVRVLNQRGLSPTYLDGWTWADEALSGTGTVAVSYTNKFGATYASGTAQAQRFKSTYGQENLAASSYIYETASDSFFRKKSLADVKTEIVTSAAVIAGLTYTPAANNQTMYIGTTAVTINRASAALALTGITSIDGSAASVASAVTFNNGGAGDASGTTFNGSTARTISYNTIGAAASGHNHAGVYEPVHSHPYLPLAGGALTGALTVDYSSGNGISGPTSGTWAQKIVMHTDAAAYNGLSVHTRWGGSGSIVFEAAVGWNGAAAGYYPMFSVYGDASATFKSAAGTTLFGIASNGALTVSSSTLVTNLNADTVDGVHASVIPYGNNDLAINYGGVSDMNTANSKFGVYAYNNPTNGPFGGWTTWLNVPGHVVGDVYGFQLAKSYWGSDYRVRSRESNGYGSWLKLWNEGNDGSGSGLDADLLDGYNTATAATASTIPVRDGSGGLTVAALYANPIYMGTGGGRKLFVYNTTNIYQGFGTDLASGSSYQSNWFGSYGDTGQGSLSMGFWSHAEPGSYIERARLDGYGRLTIGIGSPDSSLYMTDNNETTRILHCNSNRIGFLTSGGSWGTWCDNDGSWTSVASITADSYYANNNGNGTNYRIGDDAWIGDVNRSSIFVVKGTTYAYQGGIQFGIGGTYGAGTIFYDGSNAQFQFDKQIYCTGGGVWTSYYFSGTSTTSWLGIYAGQATGGQIHLYTSGHGSTPGRVTLYPYNGSSGQDFSVNPAGTLTWTGYSASFNTNATDGTGHIVVNGATTNGANIKFVVSTNAKYIRLQSDQLQILNGAYTATIAQFYDNLNVRVGANLWVGAWGSNKTLPGSASLMVGQNMFIESDGGTWRSESVRDSTTTTVPSLCCDATYGYFQRTTHSNSSLRYKREVQELEYGLQEVMKMRPVRYKGNMPHNIDMSFVGFIAEDVEELGLTEFVQYDHEGRPDVLKYDHMVAMLARAIQELNDKIDKLH